MATRDAWPRGARLVIAFDDDAVSGFRFAEGGTGRDFRSALGDLAVFDVDAVARAIEVSAGAVSICGAFGAEGSVFFAGEVDFFVFAHLLPP